MNDQQDFDDQGAIAIVGMACRFPGADTPEAFWRNLCAGVQSIQRLSDKELDDRGVSEATRQHPGYVPAFSGPSDIDKFDAAFFGISPGEAECMDPQHRMMLECAHLALEHAGIRLGSKHCRVGVFSGVGINGYLFENLYSLLPNPFHLADGRFSRDMQVGLGNEKCYASLRISHKLNLKGPNVYVEAACATSLVAVHLACKSLLDYECEAAVAGGAKIEIPYQLGYLYEEGGMTSPLGEVRAFDANAKGTMFASGAGAVVLKRLEDARREGDTIFAVIRGSAINNDGADKVGFTAPSFDGQRNVILEALAVAGVEADSVGYVETHGTGTPLGDPIEIAALTAAYRASTERCGYCAIGSLKPNVGHMEAASGVANLIKAVLALRHRSLPPSLNFDRPNPEIDFASSPFFVNTELRDWVSDGPRRAGVSSFGVGGTNAHLIVEEYIEAPARRPSRPQQLLLWSAKSDRALDAATAQLAAHLRAHPEQDLADVAHSLRTGRETFSRRRALVCDGRQTALLSLEGDPNAFASSIGEGKRATVAFLFPGQGSQHADMAASLYQNEPVFRAQFDECARLLAPDLAIDLRQLFIAAPETAATITSQLDETWLTQPLLFAVEFALAQQWRAWGVEPSAMLGHSIGEYVAACLAGVFTLPDALRLVALRGRLMHAAPVGEMLAVPLAEAELKSISVQGWDLAAVNGPTACVLSGPSAVIDQVAELLAARGVETRRLKTSHAFHSSMMEPILAAFGEAVEAVPRHPPERRFVSNLSGDWITVEQAMSAAYWVEHLRRTVRFADGVQRLLVDPGLILLEVGPGQTLSALARQQPAARGRVVISSLPHARQSRDAQAAMLAAMGQIWLADGTLDWAGFVAHEERRRVPLPTYPYERKRYWIEPPPGLHLLRAGGAADSTRMPLADWFCLPGWSMAPRPAAPKLPGPSPTDWLLFCDRGGLASALATLLRARGESVTEVIAGEHFHSDSGRFVIRPQSPEDYLGLLSALAERGQHARNIVHAWAVDHLGNDYAATQQLGFFSLLHLAQALGQSSDPEPITLSVLSSGLADVTGDEQLDPLKASLLGPVKVVGQEYPHIHCRQLDLAADPRLAKEVLAELSVPIVAGQRIALRGVHRWQSDFLPIRLDQDDATANAQPWRMHGVYLITGGFGGLGLVFAEHLARRFRARLVLIGRHALPPRSQWTSTIAALGADHPSSKRIRHVQMLEAAGAEVLPIAADVTDADAMGAAVAAAKEQFGEINGVMHAAGIAGGGIIQLKSVDDAEAVLAPKIRGAQVLFQVLAAESLDIVVLHSSLFAITGGAGQVDYCGANNALDLIARALARQGLPVVSVNWDAWTDVGMAARAASVAEPQRGHDRLALALLDGRAQITEHEDEFVVDLDPVRHWVVDEHRMDGKPVMPGTALLEMALSGFHQLIGWQCAVELRDVLFLAPLSVAPEGASRARLLLRRAEAETRFHVQSLQLGGWRDHAIGALAIADAAAGRCNLELLRERHKRAWDFAGREAQALPQDGWIGFGPRWHSVKRIAVGNAESLVDLELPAAFAADVDQFFLHPALLDVATGLANGYWLEHDGLAEEGSPFLPFGYQRVTVWQALPAKCFAHSRLCTELGQANNSLVFDILLVAPGGAILAAIEGFTLKRVNPSALANAAPPKATRALAEKTMGITPAEGLLALDRVLAYGDLPQVVISTRQVRALLNEFALPVANEDSASAERNERPDVGNAFAPPRNDIERTLAAIWESLLGMKEIGINDNFFELGGDSLLATQIPNRVRSELQVGVDLGLVFEAPTIAQIAEHISAKAWLSEKPRESVAGEAREVGTL